MSTLSVLTAAPSHTLPSGHLIISAMVASNTVVFVILPMMLSIADVCTSGWPLVCNSYLPVPQFCIRV